MRVSIAEDEARLTETLRDVIEEAGRTAVISPTGRSALTAARSSA